MYTQLNAEFQRRARRDKKDFVNEQCKKKKKKGGEKNNRMEKMKELLKGTEDIKGKIPVRKGMIKDRKSKDLTEAEEIKKRLQEHTEKLYKKRS